MAFTVWKFVIPLAARSAVQVPRHARTLAVQFQHTAAGPQLCLWAMVDPDQPFVERHFAVAGTGNPLDGCVVADGIHLGTVQSGPFVWHVFEIEVP